MEPDLIDRTSDKHASNSSPPQAVVILFLAANPSTTARLRLNVEARAVDQALRQANDRDQFDLRQHWAVRVADLQERLVRHHPHIVHFSGHGSEAGQLLLEDDQGREFAVPPNALSPLFVSSPTTCRLWCQTPATRSRKPSEPSYSSVKPP